MKKITWSLTQAGWFLGSIAVSAAVMLAFYPAWLIVMLMAVLVAHELGHFGVARLLEIKSSLPLFIPLGPLAMGATYIPTKEQKHIRAISLSGPIAGFTVSIAFLIAFLLVGSTIGIWFAAGMTLKEIFSGTIGSDGSKFRKAKEGTRSTNVSHVVIPFDIHADWSLA